MPNGETTSQAVGTASPNRLGFAVKAIGKPGLKSNDARRWRNEPHLRVSLGYLDGIFDHLAAEGIRMYRISSDIAPYVTHPDMPQFHRQIEECGEELATVGARARGLDLRLSMHPSQYIVLNSPDARIADAAVADFVYHARFLDALGTDLDAKIVTHVGGVYGDKPAAMERFAANYERLPEIVRRRLVLENDEVSYSVAEIERVHAMTGIPLIFDILHHRVNREDGRTEADACAACLRSWPEDQTPKIHYSTQRGTARTPRAGADPETAPPRAGEHDDWIDPGDFIRFLEEMEGERRFDAMLEAKAKDVALLRLREAILAGGLQARIW